MNLRPYDKAVMQLDAIYAERLALDPDGAETTNMLGFLRRVPGSGYFRPPSRNAPALKELERAAAGARIDLRFLKHKLGLDPFPGSKRRSL